MEKKHIKYIHTKIDPVLKDQAATIYSNLGLTLSQAIRFFLIKTIEENGLPFRLVGKSGN